MKRKTIRIIIVAVVLLFLAWAPWITDEYAIDKVTERLVVPPLPLVI